MKPGEALDIESQIFSDWIIGHYQDMGDLNPIYYNCCNRDNLYIAK